MKWVATVCMTKTRQCHADTHSQQSALGEPRRQESGWGFMRFVVPLSNVLVCDRLATAVAQGMESLGGFSVSEVADFLAIVVCLGVML
jgi:hypothetical protein